MYTVRVSRFSAQYKLFVLYFGAADCVGSVPLQYHTIIEIIVGEDQAALPITDHWERRVSGFSIERPAFVAPKAQAAIYHRYYDSTSTDGRGTVLNLSAPIFNNCDFASSLSRMYWR